MKNLIMTAALMGAMTASTAYAGSMADPIIEQDLIVAETAASSSSGTALVALLAITLMIPILD